MVEWAATGASKDSIVKLLPTDKEGTEIASPAFRARSGEGLAIVSGSDLLTALARSKDARRLVVARTAMDGFAATPVNGTLAIPPSALVFVRSSSPQRVERLVGGGAGQVVPLHFLSKNELVPNGRA